MFFNLIRNGIADSVELMLQKEGADLLSGSLSGEFEASPTCGAPPAAHGSRHINP